MMLYDVTMRTDKMSVGNSMNGRHWTNLLRCPVCFSYFHEPVTLHCGHTFCKGCMRRMAQMLEENNPDVTVPRLRMWCPTCRRGVSAQLFLRNNANVSFVLQDLVEGWRCERRKLATSGQILVHSTATQTLDSSADNKKSDHVSKDESYVKIRTDTQYLQAAILATDSEHSCGDVNDNRRIYPRLSGSESTIEDMHDVGDVGEDEGEEDEHHDDDDDDDIMRLDRGGWNVWRTLMVVVWATYTLVIVLLSQNYLPYMFLYTLLFILIIYTEKMPHRYAL